MNDAQDFQQRFEALRRSIEGALFKVRSGHVPVLGDLEIRAGRLCEEITASDSQTARALQPLLGDLIAQMDELVEALKNMKAEAG